MRVLFLTEGGGECGLGHLSGSAALSQSFSANDRISEVVFFVNGDKGAKD